jgi:hypothetical protein
LEIFDQSSDFYGLLVLSSFPERLSEASNGRRGDREREREREREEGETRLSQVFLSLKRSFFDFENINLRQKSLE